MEVITMDWSSAIATISLVVIVAVIAYFADKIK